MSYRFKRRCRRRKKTLSEKFEIGAGRYVHDLEFCFTPQDDDISFNSPGNGRYVHDVEFSQLGDKSDSSKHESKKLTEELKK